MYTASNEALPIRMKEYSPMNVPQNDLNEVANRAESIRSAMGRALALVNGDTAGNAQGTLLQITMENLVSLQMKLENIGAHYSPEYAPPETDPLLLQSDDNKFLLYHLQYALREAKRVDMKRGGPTGQITHMLEMSVSKVRTEVNAPKSPD